MSDGLFHYLLGVCYGIAAGPSNSGTRKDGKICTAQPGECRYNRKYYTPGMNDAKSWSDPCADESCTSDCWFLSERPRDMGSEEQRRELASDLLNGIQQKSEADKQVAALLLGSLGIDPREYLD